MNLSNPGLLDRKAANRAVAAKSAIATKSVIVTNKAVVARSPSAINKAAVGNRGVVANRAVAAKKAPDDKLRKETARALVIVPWINERREATPAVFLRMMPSAPTLLQSTPLSLHKCWPPKTQSDISHGMNRSIFYIIGVIVVIVIVLKLLGLF
jgi:hypothetical protein